MQLTGAPFPPRVEGVGLPERLELVRALQIVAGCLATHLSHTLRERVASPDRPASAASDNVSAPEKPVDVLTETQDNPDTMGQLSVVGMSGEEFLRRRKEAGLTQAEAARLLGVAARTITRWERGVSKIDVWKTAEIKRSFFPGMKRQLDVVDRLLDNESENVDTLSTGSRP